MDNITVLPDPSITAVDVATDEIGTTHYPIYKVSYGALGEQTPVSEEYPLPISFSESLISSREIKDELVELNLQMKILNKYMSKWHGDEITEEDLENERNY